MFEELLNMFLLDGEMAFIFVGLFLIFTAFCLFLLRCISHRAYGIIVGSAAVLIAVSAFAFAAAQDWGMGMITMLAGMLLVPFFVSMLFAFLLSKIFRLSMALKLLCAAFAAVIIACICVFWPKPLAEKVGEITVPETKYHYNEEYCTPVAVADKNTMELVLSQARCSPCIFTPEFGEFCVMVRLNEDYVLLSELYGDSYIFENSGEAENFAPHDACYKVYDNEQLYISIKTS